MAASAERTLRRLDAHTIAVSQLRMRVEVLVLTLLAGFEGWYDHAAITELTRRITKQVESAQRGAARATDAYLAAVISDHLGRTVRPVGIIDPAVLRAGVTHEGAYGRLADQYRRQLAGGIGAADALTLVLARATSMVATDMQLALTHQSQMVMLSNNAIVGYRRIIRPEMSRSGVCGLCLVAADQVYRKADLLPIHDRCNCGVMPMTRGSDPGISLNRDELDRIYDDAGSTYAEDLLKTRYKVEQNGEIGPVLVNEKHRHRGAREVARQGGFDSLTRSQIENQIRITEGLKASEWRSAQLDRLRNRLTELA